MINKVMRFVKEQHMFDAKDYVVAGVSGGADSVCLLFMLLEIQKVIPIALHIVHINHQIRSDAAADAQYVEWLCAQHHLPFTLVEEDVAALAAREHCSTEEAGRQVRYQAFYKVLGTRRGKIAVAHNQNDSCETFLFHLFRGTALKGLSGIPAVRGIVVRPLLCLERTEIEAFLAQRQIKFRIDSTNFEDNYTRNKIRHHILAWAEKEISPAVVNHISAASAKVRDAYELIEDFTRQAMKTCVCIRDDSYYIREAPFAILHKTIQGYVIMEVLAQASGSSRDWESVHAEQIQGLFGKQSGRQIQLPYRLCAVRDYNGVVIGKVKAYQDKIDNFEEIVFKKKKKNRLLCGETLQIPWQQQGILHFSLIKTKNLQNIPQKKYTKWFDYDTIKGSIVIRTRRSGDYLTVNAANQRKSLKSYFIDNKVPRELRGHICLIAEDSHVIWAVGGRISSYYKVSELTETILQVSYADSAREPIWEGFAPEWEKTKED